MLPGAMLVFERTGGDWGLAEVLWGPGTESTGGHRGLRDRDSGLSMAQDGVKMAQHKPKMDQDGHKMASRRAENDDMPIEVKLQGAEARAALSRV